MDYFDFDDLPFNGVFVLTLLYFAVEVFINHTLYSQLSVGSDYFTIEALEMWGKIITGFGIALVILKLTFIRENSIPVFLALCIPSIFISFILSNYIINKVVNSANEYQINKSLLVMPVRSTIVPHYDFSMASYPTDNLEELTTFKALTYPFRDKEKTTSLSYVTYKANFIELAEKCKNIGENNLGVHSKIDKAFFAISALNSPIDENVYKKTIKEYYSCLYSDPEYRDNHSNGKAMPISGLKEMYKQYQKATIEYNKALKNLRLERISKKTDNKEWRKKVDNEWRKEMDKFFGFKTTLKPNNHWESFVRSPDVRRYYLAKANNKAALYPFDENYQETFKKNITSSFPDSIIPFYKTEKTTYDLSDDYDIKPSYYKEEDEMRMAAGKKAYKAAVMPVVGMGLSAFFLVFNVLILIFSLAARVSPPTVLLVLALALSYFFFVYPVKALSHENDDKAYIAGNNKKVDWLYYHQRNIALLYDLSNERKDSQ